MKRKMLAGLITLVVLFSLILGAAPIQADDGEDSLDGCSSLAAGRLATVDGSVLFGHDEDNGWPTRLHVVPRVYHEPGETITLRTGAVIDQVVGETWAYLWSEMPFLDFSDSYLNEWGVAIGSDNCRSSREVPPYDVTDGGIRYWLRRLAIERGKTAREGVLIMGHFVEQLGYNHSGRTYIIADPQEAWFFSAVGGRHWVAQRVPDDEVAFIPNYYTIRQVDLDDTNNFLACPDLIEYAIDKGWYDPDTGPFDFAKVYNTESTQLKLSNKLRHWGALRLLTGTEYPDMNDLPFSVKPNRLLSVKDIAEVLRCHYEGTDWAWDPTSEYSSPHYYRIDDTRIRTICASSTDESSIFQLRNWMPNFVGNIYWRSQCRPCSSVYIPWYYGILEIPEPYTIGEPGVPDDPESAYWTFDKMVDLVDEDYAVRNELVRAIWDNFEKAEFARQAGIEKAALSMYYDAGKEDLARKFLTQYTERLAMKAFRTAGKLIDKLEK